MSASSATEMGSRWRSLLQLTKPTIVLLVAITGLSAMATEGSLFREPVRMIEALIAIILSAASANAFNQFIDRDIDSVMDRTKRRRPLPLHQISPAQALIFAFSLGIFSNLYLWWKFNAMSAWISVATILFYVFVYTLWLKRRHYYNIVIGGAAGATAPLIASAAAGGEPSLVSWIMFAIIFTWTPPHFWALALALKEEYAKVQVPMLPNVLGDERTRIEIVIYTLLLLPLVVIPYFLGSGSWFFLGGSFLLWLWYGKETWVQLKIKSKAAYKRLFFVSIFYLFLLFLLFALDGALRYWGIF